EFLLEIRQRNGEKKITAILDNFSTHRSKRVINYANSLNIDLVFLPPYSPDLNPIEFIWKSIKRILSTSFIGSLAHMRYIVAKAFYDFSKSISFAKNWIIKFLNDKYKKLCV
ncbi:MAG: transposase, partial [Thermoplasmata archaeon]